MKALARLTALLALLIPTVYAAPSGYALKATEVRDKPFLDATTLATLPEKTSVDILTRQGGWMQIKAPQNAARFQQYTRNLQASTP
ncbi:MAG: hypothetical protein ABI728_02580 [Betaproteobacteria bacterium]